jgi:hypothetical protein
VLGIEDGMKKVGTITGLLQYDGTMNGVTVLGRVGGT